MGRRFPVLKVRVRRGHTLKAYTGLID